MCYLYVLSKVKDEQLLNTLVDIINKDFEFETICISKPDTNYKSFKYTYNCLNHETSKYFIQLALQFQSQQRKMPQEVSIHN